jgi:hypothetical protein
VLKSISTLLSVSLLVVASNAISGRGGEEKGSRLSSDLSDLEIADLLFMREEEKLARDSYIILHELWGDAVFANISISEQQHMDAMKRLLDKYGLPDPVVDEDDVGRFVNDELDALFTYLMDLGEENGLAGLNVGGLIEEKDMHDIQAAIDAADHQDIKDVYGSLLCGSRNHLRAFVKNIELVGSTYTASVLPQEEVDAIANSPMEQCGG